MSFSNLARRFRRSRSKGSSSSSGNSQSDGPPGSSSRGGSAPPPLPVGGDTFNSSDAAQTRMEMPTPLLAQPPPPLTMPEPTTPAAPAPAAANPMNGALTDLAPMYAQLDAGPSVSRSEKTMDTLGDKINGFVGKANEGMSLLSNVAPVVAAIGKTDFAQSIERGIQHFTDDIPWLMKGLDELARIHPAVTVAVLAFKAVYALETTRQENDRRVTTLYVEMKDMMMVMIQLKGVENRTHIGLDGMVLKDRLEVLAEKTAKDIKDCANVCDTFLKKRLLVKVLKGPAWAEKLTAFVKTFSERKADFQFALAMHTANSITDVKKQTVEIDAKLATVIALFDRFVSAEERKLVAEIEREGGPVKVRQSEKSLKNILAFDISLRSAPVAEKEAIPGATGRDKAAAVKQRETISGPPAPRDGHATTKDGVSRGKDGVKEASITLDDLKWELREDIDEALDRNFETFIGKFELQVSLLQVALERYIRTENDRVIGAVKEAVTQGPHMKIRHPELRKIWQDMNWRGNVKARLFVMTLRDHYRDVIEDAQHTSSGKEDIINDAWTLEYFGPSWLQPMMDAFDDDASGYVTISEVNKVMDLQPPSLGWSVPRWLAYWAAGWGLAATQYAAAIDDTIRHMRDALPRILPLNRSAVDKYLAETWPPSLVLTAGVQWNVNPELLARFQAYLDWEEEGLRSNLERIKYHIDASDTLSLVLGPRKLEKCILPLLSLLLRNHYQKIKAAQSFVLAELELENAQRTMETLFAAVNSRYVELEDLFTEQKLDPVEHFKKYARGLFANHSYTANFWGVDNMGNFAHQPPLEEAPEVDISGIEQDTESDLDTSRYDAVDEETEDDLLAPMPVKAVLGLWNGFPWEDSVYPARGMLSLRFHYSHAEGEDFTGSGVEFDGDPYVISGTCDVDDSGQITAFFSITYGDLIIYYSARLVDEFTLEGWRGYEPGQLDDWQFVFKKIPAEQMFFRPSPPALKSSNKARELWQYAISATVHEIRRKNWSWAYFVQRRDARRRYVELYRQSYGRPNPNVDEDWHFARSRCTAPDLRFYSSLAERFNRVFPFHQGRWCDNMECWAVIGGARLICLDCVVASSDFYLRVNFCDDPRCYDVTLQIIGPDEQHHHPGHDLVKVRTIIQNPAMAELFFLAQRGLDHYREGIYPPNPPSDDQDDVDQATGEGDERPCVAGEEQVETPEAHQSEAQDLASDGDRSAGGGSAPQREGEIPSGVQQEQPPNPRAGDILEPAAAAAAKPAHTAIPDPAESSVTGVVGTSHESRSPTPNPPEPSTVVLDPPNDSQEPAELPSDDVQADGNNSVTEGSISPQDFKCRVCNDPVYVGRCWFCLECWDYVCNDCDSQCRIRCCACEKAFPQAEWYSGIRASDFICVMCSAKGVKEPPDASSDPGQWHVSTHPLVQCKYPVPDPPKDPPEEVQLTTEHRLASLEERMAAMDAKLEHLQEHLAQLEKTQTDMQQVILSRLDETLLRVVGRVMNERAQSDPAS